MPIKGRITPEEWERRRRKEEARLTGENPKRTPPSVDHPWRHRPFITGKIKKVAQIILLSVSTLWAGEVEVIEAAVNRNVPDVEIRPLFVRLLKAIRKAENGPKGMEFGITNPDCRGFEKQAGWCAQKCYAEYRYWLMFECDKQDYIDYLATQYAPVGVANDPKNLNRNWSRNVKNLFNKEDK